MSFGDIGSLIFVVIILASFAWPFVRDKGRRRAGSLMNGPKGFLEGGGYNRPSARSGQAAPRPRTGYENEEAMHRLRVEERLTRDEILERGSNVRAEPRNVRPTSSRLDPVRCEGKRSHISADQIYEQLGSAESAQMAFVLKEVFDRPVAMRDT